MREGFRVQGSAKAQPPPPGASTSLYSAPICLTQVQCHTYPAVRANVALVLVNKLACTKVCKEHKQCKQAKTCQLQWPPLSVSVVIMWSFCQCQCHRHTRLRQYPAVQTRVCRCSSARLSCRHYPAHIQSYPVILQHS